MGIFYKASSWLHNYLIMFFFVFEFSASISSWIQNLIIFRMFWSWEILSTYFVSIQCVPVSINQILKTEQKWHKFICLVCCDSPSFGSSPKIKLLFLHLKLCSHLYNCITATKASIVPDWMGKCPVICALSQHEKMLYKCNRYPRSTCCDVGKLLIPLYIQSDSC